MTIVEILIIILYHPLRQSFSSHLVSRPLIPLPGGLVVVIVGRGPGSRGWGNRVTWPQFVEECIIACNMLPGAMDHVWCCVEKRARKWERFVALGTCCCHA